MTSSIVSRYLFKIMRAPLLLVLLSMWACTPAPLPSKEAQVPKAVEEPLDNDKEENTMRILITVGDKTFKADIENTETGKAFIGKLPLALDMSELNGNEKYCYGVSLPRDDKYFESIAAET